MIERLSSNQQIFDPNVTEVPLHAFAVVLQGCAVVALGQGDESLQAQRSASLVIVASVHGQPRGEALRSFHVAERRRCYAQPVQGVGRISARNRVWRMPSLCAFHPAPGGSAATSQRLCLCHYSGGKVEVPVAAPLAEKFRSAVEATDRSPNAAPGGIVGTAKRLIVRPEIALRRGARQQRVAHGVRAGPVRARHIQKPKPASRDVREPALGRQVQEALGDGEAAQRHRGKDSVGIAREPVRRQLDRAERRVVRSLEVADFSRFVRQVVGGAAIVWIGGKDQLVLGDGLHGVHQNHRGIIRLDMQALAFG